MQILDKKYNYNGEILTEVRAGQTGRGLLIENDGHILTNTDTIKQIREDISHGDKFIVPDDFIVSAVFQKYGIQNKNGRIYPEAVLKREVDNYIKEAIASHCAVGAVDHPSCCLAGTLILTEKGWVDIKDVQVGDNILTVTEDKKIEVHPVRKKIDEPYKGKLIHLKSRFIDVRVTPNHRFPVLDRNHNFKGFYTAQDILDHNIPDQGHSSLFKYGEWEGANDENFTIDAIPEEDRYITLNDKSLTATEEDYDGRVYCVEVENHTFYAMGEDGHCFWSGNSLSLSGHDVSHNILELHWEGATLVGKMKLHVSPGFKRYGICSTSGDLAANMIIDGIRIGVSSRGAGNVVEKNGIYYVDDSFSLVGWDIVLEPSTPGSYIDENPENLRQFIDMRPNVEDSNMDNKLDLISKILQSYKS